METTEARIATGTIRIGDAVSAFRKSRLLIAAATIVGTCLGLAIALLSKPAYLSEAVIAPKEQPSSRLSSGLLSQFGGLGGVMAAQLGGGGANLSRLEVLLKGRDVAESILENGDLLPGLYPERWDGVGKRWNAKAGDSLPPSKADAIRRLRRSIRATVDSKKSIIKVGFLAGDSTLAWKLTSLALDNLNRKLRADLVKEANANMEFLEEQLSRTSDPLLMEKIHQLMTQELEKSMLVNSNLFDILERPVVPDMRVRPQRVKIVVLSFMLSLMVSLFVAAALSYRQPNG